MNSLKKSLGKMLSRKRLFKDKSNGLLVCRICLTILKDQYLEITTTVFQDKTLLQLIEIVGLVAIETKEPRHLCIPCCQNLCKFYLFRKQIKSTEDNLKRKRLTIIHEDGKSKCCFVDISRTVQSDSAAVPDSTIASTEEVLEEITLEIKNEVNDLSSKDRNDGADFTEHDYCQYEGDKEKENDIEKIVVEKKEERVDIMPRYKVDGLNYACQFCSMNFATLNQLCIHYKYKHSDKRPTFYCTDCRKYFSSGKTLKYHRVRVHSTVKPFVCQYCNKSFALISYLRSHIKQRHNISTSKKTTERKLSTPKPIRKEEQDQNITVEECPICKQEFYSLRLLDRHVLEHEEHGFTCDKCNAVFRFKSRLVRHKLKIHSTDKPFLCHTCGKSYALQSDLKRHTEVHETDKKFLCEICSKQCASRLRLNEHRRTHSKKKLVECKVCGKQFNRNYFAHHMQVHDSTKFRCEICGEEFNIQKSLYVHKRKVHLGNMKPTSCDICGAKFILKAYMVKHKMTAHLGVRYKCDICGSVYTTKYKTKLHVKRSHPDRMADVENVVNEVKIKQEDKKDYAEDIDR